MLSELDRLFDFNEDCLKSFIVLKKAFFIKLVVVAPNKNMPFEFMCDSSDYFTSAVLG